MHRVHARLSSARARLSSAPRSRACIRMQATGEDAEPHAMLRRALEPRPVAPPEVLASLRDPLVIDVRDYDSNGDASKAGGLALRKSHHVPLNKNGVPQKEDPTTAQREESKRVPREFLATAATKAAAAAAATKAAAAAAAAAAASRSQVMPMEWWVARLHHSQRQANVLRRPRLDPDGRIQALPVHQSRPEGWCCSIGPKFWVFARVRHACWHLPQHD